MVVVSHSHRFIYLKTFKTASTSTEVALEKFALPQGAATGDIKRTASVSDAGIVGHRGPKPDGAAPVWHGHMSARDVAEKLPADQWDSYFKFTTVRNPFERLVSHFAMRNPAHFVGKNPQSARIAAFEDWLENSTEAREDLAIYGINGTAIVDDAIRFEHLEADRTRICAQLGLTTSWPHLRHNPDRWAKVGDWRALYSDAARARVAALYHWEINAFGYEFLPEPAFETQD